MSINGILTYYAVLEWTEKESMIHRDLLTRERKQELAKLRIFACKRIKKCYQGFNPSPNLAQGVNALIELPEDCLPDEQQ